MEGGARTVSYFAHRNPFCRLQLVPRGLRPGCCAPLRTYDPSSHSALGDPPPPRSRCPYPTPSVIGTRTPTPVCTTSLYQSLQPPLPPLPLTPSIVGAGVVHPCAQGQAAGPGHVRPQEGLRTGQTPAGAAEGADREGAQAAGARKEGVRQVYSTPLHSLACP